MTIFAPEEQSIIIPDGASFDYLTDVCSDPSGQTIVFNAPFQDTDANGENSVSNAGAVYIASTNNKFYKVVPPPKWRNSEAVFGHHVDISSDAKVIVASARGDTSNTGAFYILVKQEGSYKVVKRVQRSVYTEGDKFGFSIGIGQNLDGSVPLLGSDEYLIVCGSPFWSFAYTGQGRVDAYIYNLTDNTVRVGGRFTVSTASTNQNHGYSIEVAKNASRVLISARESDLSGLVQLYTPHPTSGWEVNRTPDFEFTTSTANDYLGIANSNSPTTFTYRPMAISPDGTWFAAGAMGEGNGTVRIWSGDSPYSLQKTYTNDVADTFFGGSVSMSEDFIVIGEQEYDVSSNEGAYQYASYTTSWGGLTRKTADTPTINSYYGYDVFVSDNHVFTVASDYNNGAVQDIGAVYVDEYRSGAFVSATDTEVQKPVDYWLPDTVTKKKRK